MNKYENVLVIHYVKDRLFVTLREPNPAEPNDLTHFYSGDVIRLSILNNKELSVTNHLLTSDS